MTSKEKIIGQWEGVPLSFTFEEGKLGIRFADVKGTLESKIRSHVYANPPLIKYKLTLSIIEDDVK